MELLQHLIVIAVAWFIVSILTALALGRWLALQDQRAMRAQPRQAMRSMLDTAGPAVREAECSTPRRSRRARLMQRLVAVTHH